MKVYYEAMKSGTYQSLMELQILVKYHFYDIEFKITESEYVKCSSKLIVWTTNNYDRS